MYDLLLKGGEVIDPMQGIHDRLDVALQDGKIAAIAKNIADSEAREVIPVNGKLVVPGLIDIHCHPLAGLTPTSLPPDEMGLDSGVTLLCDGGSVGAANFYTMRRLVAEPARTDIFIFLNLASTGLATIPEIWDQHDINPEFTRRIAESNRDLVKGIKIRAIQPLAEGLGIKAVEIARKLALDLKLPLMLHIGESRNRVASDIMDDFSRASVRLLKKGDILSHFLTWEAGGMFPPDGSVYQELRQAGDRGVILDSCHGMSHFSFAVARQALQQGFLPTVISTDLGVRNMPIVQSLMVTMSKFLNLGLTIDQVIEMTTSNPAKALGEESRHGSLKTGMSADITVLEIVEGDYLFSDGKGGGSMKGKLLLEPRLVLKNGAVRPCRSHYSIPPVYTNN